MEQTQTDDEGPTAPDETTPLFRLHWRNAAGATGHGTGLYSEDEANTWVAALNRDESNIKLGRVYWAEPVAK